VVSSLVVAEDAEDPAACFRFKAVEVGLGGPHSGGAVEGAGEQARAVPDQATEATLSWCTPTIAISSEVADATRGAPCGRRVRWR
jgi:hypothetical protein